MTHFSFPEIEAMAARQPAGFRDEVIGCAEITGPDGILIDTGSECWRELLRKYRRGNLARGAVGLAKAALRIQRAPPEVIAARRAVCGGCEHATVKLGIVQACNLCGCALAAKLVIAREACPAGKWPAHAESTPKSSG